MKINRNYTQYINKNTYNNAKDNKNIEKKEEPSVSVEISQTAKELVKKIEALEDTKMSEKVEAIRKSIMGGTYKVSSEEIADKMMEFIDKEKANK